ncbi:hypothetical protein TNCV_3439671 [Trichonephila clavipes]|nr:hypothetical protein TNCV_3439671 [Trichonephila clavipes]
MDAAMGFNPLPRLMTEKISVHSCETTRWLMTVDLLNMNHAKVTMTSPDWAPPRQTSTPYGARRFRV